MKKIINAAVCFMICFAILSSMTSCDIIRNYQNKYDDGPVTEADVAEWYCVDYEEVIAIRTLLKSHGSIMQQIPYFECETPGVDVRFVIYLPKGWSDDLENKMDYFDKRMDNLIMHCCIFLKETSYTDLDFYFYEYLDCIRVDPYRREHSKVIESPVGAEDIDVYRDGDRTYKVFYNGKEQFLLETNRGFELTQEQLELFKQSIAIIE